MTTIKVLGWEATGLRCPDHSVDFRAEGDEVYPVSLLQMPNGTGKTTTLTMLRAALSGTGSEWTPDQVLRFQKRDSDSANGQFILRLLIDGRRTTIQMNFRFDDGRVLYATTLPGGMRDGFHPPGGLERFFRADFVRLFVFDGELAAHLLDSAQTDAERAIEDLFLLKTFNHIRMRTTEFWEREVEARRVTATAERGLVRRTNRLRELGERLAQMLRKQGELARERDRVREQRDDMEHRYREELDRHEEARERLAAATQRVEIAKAARRELTKQSLEASRDPAALSQSIAVGMLDLKNNLDRARLPETAAREFFQDLLLEAECVCGRPMDDAAKQAVSARRDRYLGSDEVGLLNAIKGTVGEQLGTDHTEPDRQLTELFQELRHSSSEVALAQTELDALESTIVRSDPRLESAREDLQNYNARLAQIDEELQQFDDTRDGNLRDEDVTGIDVLRRRKRQAENAVAEITHTLTLKRKRDLLIRILDEARTRARDSLSQAICAQANDRIERLMPYNEIRIERIDRSLKLRGQEGGSVGETLSVGYAFLSTLFSTDGFQLPIVVDSPANAIDLAVRPEVARLVPDLGSQFIGFTISSERQGFADEVEERIPGRVQYLTLFRRQNEELMASLDESVPRTASTDGVLVVGREFFSRFHADEE